VRFQQQDCWTERATDKQRAAARRHDCHTATVKKMGKALADVCYILPQSACKKTQKAKATDGSSHRRRRLYGKILQKYNRAAATDTHTHDPSTNSTGNPTYSLASEAKASHRPDGRSDARPSPKTSQQHQQQQRQQAPSREFQLGNWKKKVVMP